MLENVDNIINKLSKTEKVPDCNTFATSLFEIEYVAHVAHLQFIDRSYAKHMALKELYEGIVDLRDRFVETYQGKYGIIKNYSTINPNEGKNIVSYVTNALDLAEKTKLNIPDGYLKQLIDDIIELYAGVLAKLKFLS